LVLKLKNLRFDGVDVVGEIYQSHNVDSKLSKNGSNDIHIEDVGLRSLLGQTLDRLEIISMVDT
jgi:hypothetical protein